MLIRKSEKIIDFFFKKRLKMLPLQGSSYGSKIRFYLGVGAKIEFSFLNWQQGCDLANSIWPISF